MGQRKGNKCFNEQSMHQYRTILFKSTDSDLAKRPDYSFNCSARSTNVEEVHGGANSSFEQKCLLSGWPWLSKTGLWIGLLFVSHTQMNESLLLDELTIFGQIGGNAGMCNFWNFLNFYLHIL